MTRHTTISYIKSAVRIGGFVILLVSLPVGVLTLIIAEIIGIIEEIGT